MKRILGQLALPGAFVVLFAAESLRPLRPRVASRWARLRRNLALGATATLVHGGAMMPVMMLVARRSQGAGLARLVPGPQWVRDAAAFVLLDYATYLWHRSNHEVPLLWRFHAVHHSDVDLDVTTAARFHPGEIALSVLAAAIQARVVGPRPAVAAAYAVAMQVAAAFHHANLRLSPRVDRALAAVVVTPRMHGVHHAARREEADANWSVIFSVWDRIHRTLRLDVPAEGAAIGLPAYRDPEELGIVRLLGMPFGRQRPSWQGPGPAGSGGGGG